MFYKISQRYYSKNKNFFVTTPIFYVNAAPHIGHLYSALIADAISRYEHIKNPYCNIKFSTGTDEHGTKIQQSALRHKLPTAQYCDKISEKYKNIFKNANINYTDFIRTTESKHKYSVNAFWNILKSKNLIYSSQYSGWYCVSDETFLIDSQMNVNPDGSRTSIESGHPCEWTEEFNYMFPLRKFQEEIIYWIKSKNPIKPKKFEKILLDYLNEPLPDLSISRPTSRVHWGIPVPGDESQTIYVWLDALVNYLTCARFSEKDFNQYWPCNVQVIGKDILKFHGIYWPAFLIAAGIEPPKSLFVHSHWTVDGVKMSKSKFNVVDPLEKAEVYTMEGLRYFLLREGVAHSDGNYSDIKISRIVNSELADTIGNLLSRVCAKALNINQVYPVLNHDTFSQLLELEITNNLVNSLVILPEKCFNHYELHNFYLVVDEIISTLHTANNFFETCKPWEMKKNSSPNNLIKLETTIALAMDTLRICGILLQPIIPEFSNKLLNKLNIPLVDRFWKNIKVENEKLISLKQKYLSYRNSTFTSTEKKLSSLEDAVLFRRILIKDEATLQKRNSKSKTKEKVKN